MQTRLRKNVILLTITAVVCFIIAVFNCKSVALASEDAFTIVVGDKKYVFSSCEIGKYQGRLYLKCAEGVVDGIYYDTGDFRYSDMGILQVVRVVRMQKGTIADYRKDGREVHSRNVGKQDKLVFGGECFLLGIEIRLFVCGTWLGLVGRLFDL